MIAAAGDIAAHVDLPASTLSHHLKRLDFLAFWEPHLGERALHPFIDEALAVSCNIVFADLGLRLGDERIRPLHLVDRVHPRDRQHA